MNSMRPSKPARSDALSTDWGGSDLDAEIGASIRDRSGYWTTSSVVSFVVGTLSLAGAVTAAVLLILG